MLTWSELWDVLRWYAHNRGYDGNKGWSRHEADAADEEDTEKEKRAGELLDGFRVKHGRAGTMAEVFLKLSKGPGAATPGTYFSTPIYLALYFLLVPGTLFCYQTGTPARLFTLLKSGLDHFWRFFRITLISLVVFAVVLGGLHALQNVWSDHVDQRIVGRPAFLLELAGLVIIGLVAALLRLYFDLVQVYTVHLGQLSYPVEAESKRRPERQIRRTFRPAWRTCRRNFLRAYATFLFLTLLGLAAVVLTARAAIHSLAQPRVWPMFLLAQLGLFLMLLTRFWQRGAETILVLDNPMPVPVAVVPAPAVPEEIFPAPTDPEPVPDEPAPEHIENEEVKDRSSVDPPEYSI